MIGYLIAARNLAPAQALQALMAGVPYERLVVYVGAPTAVAVKVLGGGSVLLSQHYSVSCRVGRAMLSSRMH